MTLTARQSCLLKSAEKSIIDYFIMDSLEYNELCFETGMLFAQFCTKKRGNDDILTGKLKGFWGFWTYYYALNDYYLLERYQEELTYEMYLKKKYAMARSNKVYFVLLEHIATILNKEHKQSKVVKMDKTEEKLPQFTRNIVNNK